MAFIDGEISSFIKPAIIGPAVDARSSITVDFSEKEMSTYESPNNPIPNNTPSITTNVHIAVLFFIFSEELDTSPINKPPKTKKYS